jgi:predicted RNase H-like HicB family nuclease
MSSSSERLRERRLGRKNTNEDKSAYAPDLLGCIAAGDTVRQTAELMRKAIEMHVAGMSEDGLPVPEPTAVAAARPRNR